MSSGPFVCVCGPVWGLIRGLRGRWGGYSVLAHNEHTGPNGTGRPGPAVKPIHVSVIGCPHSGHSEPMTSLLPSRI